MAGKGDKRRPTTPGKEQDERDSHERAFGKEEIRDNSAHRDKLLDEANKAIGEHKDIKKNINLIKVEPTRGHLIVLSIPDKAVEEKSDGGLYLGNGDEVKAKSYARGEVIAIGDLLITDAGTDMPINYKVGDTLVYSEYGVGKILDKDGDRELIVLAMQEILCKEVN